MVLPTRQDLAMRRYLVPRRDANVWSRSCLKISLPNRLGQRWEMQGLWQRAAIGRCCPFAAAQVAADRGRAALRSGLHCGVLCTVGGRKSENAAFIICCHADRGGRQGRG